MAEIRTCSSCKKPAVVVMKTWGTTGMLGSTDRISRTDYRCQACGNKFRVLPWHVVRTLVGGVLSIQMGLLAGFLCSMGLVVLFESPGYGLALAFPGAVGVALAITAFVWSVSSSWYLLRNPLAAGAEVPELRYGEDLNLRSCTCGGTAPAVRSVANTTNGIPTGTDTTHRCSTCGEEFTVSDVWGMIFMVLVGTVLTPVGLILAPDAWHDMDAFSIGLVVVCLGGGLTMFVLAGRGARDRWSRHPPIETTS